MTIHGKIKDEKIQDDINREPEKHIGIIMRINMNILQGKKYYHLIKVER